jgi:starvation-inducible DNA-binding protein
LQRPEGSTATGVRLNAAITFLEGVKGMDAETRPKVRNASHYKPSYPTTDATNAISGALNLLLADMFALYLKTNNVHWHMSGPQFRDCHLLMNEQADQIFATTDSIAERVCNIGGTTMRSVCHIARLPLVLDNDTDYVQPLDLLGELRGDNKQIAQRLRETHGLCDEHEDGTSASLIDTWIDEAVGRAWFLFETARRGDVGGY